MCENYLGFIFHIGLYSFFAFDDMNSAVRRKIQNGSEWYLERIQNRKYRSVSGSEQTKKYHTQFGDNFDYFSAPYCITRESISNWLDLILKCNAKYAIITAKHHDGYCNWPTQTNNPKSKFDVIAIFREECVKRNLIFGIYYSWFEFLNPMTISFFENTCIPHIIELLQYQPQIYWFDGDWVIKQKHIINKIKEIVFLLRNNNIIFNDRITPELKHLATFQVGPDRSFPSIHTDNFQHINTIGLSWGYNSQQRKEHYKNGEELYQLYTKTVSLGGSLLLNIGPKYNGELDENEVKSLEEFQTIVLNEVQGSLRVAQ